MSNEAKKLYETFKTEYINGGYAYSGSLSYTWIKKQDFSQESILELQTLGLIEQRNCDAYAYELTKNERKKIIIENNLQEIWENNKIAKSFYPNDLKWSGEIAVVMQ